jgi:hypothetical protein
MLFVKEEKMTWVKKYESGFHEIHNAAYGFIDANLPGKSAKNFILKFRKFS